MRIVLAKLHLLDPLWLIVIEVLLNQCLVRSTVGTKVSSILHLLEMNAIMKSKTVQSIIIGVVLHHVIVRLPLSIVMVGKQTARWKLLLLTMKAPPATCLKIVTRSVEIVNKQC